MVGCFRFQHWVTSHFHSHNRMLAQCQGRKQENAANRVKNQPQNWEDLIEAIQNCIQFIDSIRDTQKRNTSKWFLIPRTNDNKENSSTFQTKMDFNWPPTE